MGFFDWFRKGASLPGPRAASNELEPDESGPAAAIRQLEESGLLDPDFPRRWAATHAQFAQATEVELAARHEPGIEAINLVPDPEGLVELVRLLGRERYVPAVPLLTRLWSDCALQPVWVAAGHALRNIGTPEALLALQDAIEDSDHLSVFLAVRATFDEDPKAAYDRFAPRFAPERLAEPGGVVVPGEVLRTFAPSSFRVGKDKELVPLWHDERAPQWFLEDPRWIDLCARFRRDQVLGVTVRSALRYAEAGPVRLALEQARAREPVVSRPVRSAAPGDLVTRYRRGDHVAVWAELKAPPVIDGAFREEAFAVAQETMRRFLAASELLASRLGEAGWRPLAGAFRNPRTGGDAALMAEAERLTGAPLPPALRAFWEVVGGIDFVWDYQGDDEPPDLGVELDQEDLDALSIGSAENLGGAIERWHDENSDLLDPDLAEPFFVDLAPDRLTKANISGGGPYGVELPFAGADPRFGNEEWSAPLVDYLRSAVRWGGFPGLAQHPDQKAVKRLLAKLTPGLEPF